MNYKFFGIAVLILSLIGVASADVTSTNYTAGQDGPYYYSSGDTWATARGGAGSYLYSLTVGSDPQMVYLSSSNTNAYNVFVAEMFGYNLAWMNSSMTITSAKFGVYGTGKANTFSSAASLELSNGTPTNYASIAATDFNKRKWIPLATNITYAGYSTTGWNNFTLNSDGLAYLTARRGTNATMVLESSYDMYNTAPSGSGVGKEMYYGFSSTAHTGASQDPFLEITWTVGGAPAAPVASFTIDRTLLRIPKLVTVTDTSTNTPTSWEWSWGDGTANSTTQNPSHTYTKRGKFTINMAAINDGGTGVATAASVRVVGYENHY